MSVVVGFDFPMSRAEWLTTSVVLRSLEKRLVLVTLHDGETLEGMMLDLRVGRPHTITRRSEDHVVRIEQAWTEWFNSRDSVALLTHETYTIPVTRIKEVRAR